MSLDRNAVDTERLRRNSQRFRAGDGTNSVKLAAPLAFSAGAINLSLFTTGGLQLSSNALSVKLADTSLQLAAGGLSVLKDPAGALSVSVSGLAVAVDGSTITIAADKIGVPAGGIGTTQLAAGAVTAAKLGILTTKGDVLGFDTAANRIPAGTNGNVLTADSTQALGVKWAAPAGATTYSLKNRLLNGNFDLWQRGTSFSTTVYTADRWKVTSIGTGGAFSLSQFSVPVMTIGSSVQALYAADINLSQVSSTPTIQQPIEFVRTLAGANATLSFWMKAAGTVVHTVTANLVQHFGTGGTPSADVTTAITTITPNGTWTQFTATVAVPSIAGKTLGTNNDDYLAVQFVFTGPGVANSAEYWLTQVQLEPGSTATDFEWRPLSAELLLCQRFYERSYSLSQATGTVSSLGPAVVPNSVSILAASTAGNVGNGSTLGFKVEKRKAPTIVFYDFAGNANGTHVNNTAGADADRDGATAQGVNAAGNLQFITYDATGATAITRNSCIFAHWTADAEL